MNKVSQSKKHINYKFTHHAVINSFTYPQYMSFLPAFVPAFQKKVLASGMVKSSPMMTSVLASPAGPFTIHFWAPTFKWCITIANIADLSRPIDQVSTPQQCAVTATGGEMCPI